MKKFLMYLTATIVAIVSISENAFADWRFYHDAADELKGTAERYSSVYFTESKDAFVCWSTETSIKIAAGRGIFDYDDDYVYVVVGFYEGDELKEKVTTKFFVPEGDRDTAYSSEFKTPGLGEKIKNHLKTVGKVRILASKYSGADFDLTIPMNPSIK